MRSARDIAVSLCGRTYHAGYRMEDAIESAIRYARIEGRDLALRAVADNISDECGRAKTGEAYRTLAAAWRQVVAMLRRC